MKILEVKQESVTAAKETNVFKTLSNEHSDPKHLSTFSIINSATVTVKWRTQ